MLAALLVPAAWLLAAAPPPAIPGDARRDAMALSAAGRLDEALAALERQLAEAEARGAAEGEVAPLLDALLTVHMQRRDAVGMQRTLERVLPIRERQVAGRGVVATFYIAYGTQFLHAYQFATAERLLRQAVVAAEESGDRAQQAMAHLQLGWLFHAKGELDRADAAMGRCLALYRELHGAESSIYAGLLEVQARRDLERGRSELAKARFDEAEAAWHALMARATAGGPVRPGDDPDTLVSRLVANYAFRGQPERAWPLLEGQLQAREEAHGQDSLEVTLPLLRMATLALDGGHYAKALPFLQRSAAIELGPAGQATGILTANRLLVDALKGAGDRAGALQQSERLLARLRALVGERHPLVGFHVERQGVLRWATGDVAGALGELEAAAERTEPHVELALATGSEADNRAYMAMLTYQLDLAVSLHLWDAKSSPRAAALAAETLLRRKARVLDAVAGSLAALEGRLTADHKALLAQLAAARDRLARAVVAAARGALPGADATRQLGALEDEVKRLEAAVRTASAPYRALTAPARLADVRKAIPADARLVELVRYHRFDPAKVGAAQLGKPRYAAYIIAPEGAPGPAVRGLDLGDAAMVDREMGYFVRVLASPERGDVDAVAKKAYEVFWIAVERNLDAVQHVLLAPDGALNLVPFGAMVDQNDRHLVRRTTFTYLTSGRDLLRPGAPAARQGPAIFADPAFPEAPPADRPGRRSRERLAEAWQALPGTREEAAAIAARLAGAQVLTREAATEGALKALAGPSVLHIATHGFFLGAPKLDAEEQVPERFAVAGLRPVTIDGTPPLTPRAVTAAAAGPLPPAEAGENPLLRSGIVLAHGSGGDEAGDDGVLTALEASSLDLWGTHLVVLSACETGRGAVTHGEGVQGLRRALVLAGAETQVMSLWKVDDQATRELMTRYYARLQAGEGRSEALRRVQMELRREPRFQHPYYWAGFIAAGRWEPLAAAAAPGGEATHDE